MNRRTLLKTLASAASASAVCGTRPLRALTTINAAADQPAVSAQFSVMLWTVFTELPFEQRLAKIAESGYTNVELVGEYAKWTPADFQHANEARKRLNIRFDATAGLPHGVGDPSARSAFLDDLKQALVPMQSLGIPSMIVMSGNVVPGLTRTEQHNSCIEGLKRAAASIEGKQIEGQPIRLLLECIDPEENPKYFLQSAAEALEIVRTVDHPHVMFLYDLFHEQIGEGNLIEKLEKNIDKIGLIHVADVPGRHEPGTGEINYANIYRKLAELKYDRMIAMEFQPTGDPVATLRAAKAEAVSAFQR